jgi:hypothetical protein
MIMPRVGADVSEAREFKPLDPEWYQVEIAKVPEAGKAKSTGNPVISVEFDVIGGPTQKDESEPEGRKLFKTIPLTGEGTGILLNFLDAFGIDYEKEGNQVVFDTDDCLQARAEVKVRIREYEGEKQSDLRRFRVLGSAREQDEE